MSDLTDRLTSLTRDLILIPSTDGRPAERRRAFQFFLNHLQGLPELKIETYQSGDYESLLALPKDVAQPDVLLCGHLDVVEHPSLESYQSTIVDGRIVGPGAGDMKGALSILLELFLSNHRRQPGISLGLAITSDEEIGGHHGLRFLVEDQGLRCGLAIIPDGGSLTDITIEEKGILHQRVRATGEAAHAARPWLVENALHRMLGSLHHLMGSFESLRQPSEADGSHWYPTCSITQTSTRNTSVNRIPGHAEASLDIRFPPPHSMASMERWIDELLGVDEHLQVETLIGAEPTVLDPDPSFIAITEQVTGESVRRVRASGGSDARFLCAHGIPVLLSRPTVGNLHGDDEWIDIASMETYFTICDRYLRQRFQPGDTA